MQSVYIVGMSDLPPYPGVEIESDDVAWKGRFTVRRIAFSNLRFDGRRSGRRVWELQCRGHAAAMLPYDPITDQVVMIEQFRLPALAANLPPVMMEIPAGLLEKGEDPAEAIAREMEEEAGLHADRVEKIGDFLLTPGGSDECCTIFVGRVRAPKADAQGIAGYAGLANEDEDIRIRVMDAPTAIAQTLAGEYQNSVTSLALMWLAAKREDLRRQWSLS